MPGDEKKLMATEIQQAWDKVDGLYRATPPLHGKSKFLDPDKRTEWYLKCKMLPSEFPFLVNFKDPLSTCPGAEGETAFKIDSLSTMLYTLQSIKNYLKNCLQSIIENLETEVAACQKQLDACNAKLEPYKHVQASLKD